MLDGQPPVGGQNLTTSMRPTADVADQLRHSYGKVVTYEDGLWEWPGEMRPSGPNTTGKGALIPTAFSFIPPDESGLAPDLPTKLSQILAEYHRQTQGPRFQILTSSYGLHLVPLQVRDRSGQFAPAQNALDEQVVIPQQERTARNHMLALISAVAAAGNGLEMFFFSQVESVSGRQDAFNYLFAAAPADNHPFPWGTNRPNMTARDALIDLLGRSATTFFWDMRCRGTGSEKYNICVLNLGPLEITTVGADGRPMERQLRYDRCGGCAGARLFGPAAAKQK
jgi:hypothetical protein